MYESLFESTSIIIDLAEPHTLAKVYIASYLTIKSCSESRGKYAPKQHILIKLGWWWWWWWWWWGGGGGGGGGRDTRKLTKAKSQFVVTMISFGKT